MKPLLMRAFLLCALCGVSAVAVDAPVDKKPQTPFTRPSTQPVAFNKFCAVETENPVDPTVPTVIYDGKVIGFCCEDCIPKFKKNPKLYMKDIK